MLEVLKQQFAFRGPASGASAHQQVHFVLCHIVFLQGLLLTFNIFVVNRDNAIKQLAVFDVFFDNLIRFF